MEKKIFFVRFVFPFVFFICIYVLCVQILAKYIFFVPEPEAYTLFKFAFSKILAAAGIENFPVLFDLPREFTREILAAGGSEKVAAETFFLFADGVPVPDLYKFFPFWVFGSFFLSTAFLIRGLSGLSEEERRKRQKHIRGIRKIKEADFCKKTRKADSVAARIPTKAGDLWLDGQRIKEHLLILGSTGTGKSQLLINIVAGLRKNTHARLIFVDRKGEFYSLFGDRERDILFNPFDLRHIGWNIFDEIKVETDENGEFSQIPQDVVTICDTLTQPKNGSGGQNPFWQQAASMLLQSCFCYCIMNGKAEILELLKIINLDVEKLSSIIHTLPQEMQKGAAVLGTGSQASGVRATAAAAVRQLDPFAGSGDGWSVRKWIRRGKGNLYISTAGKRDESFSSVVSLLIDMIGDEIKEFPDAGGQGVRIAFVLDEFSALPRMRTINYLLRESRSKGCSVIIANQTFERIRATYGDHVARDIVANCKNRFFFALPEASDAKYISDLVGSAEVERETENESSTIGRNSSTSAGRSRQIVQDPAFLPAEIAALKTGEAIAALAAVPGFTSKIRFLPAVVKEKREKEFLEVQKHEIEAREICAVPESEPGNLGADRREPVGRSENIEMDF